MIIVTQDLKDTLEKHPHIEKVYFNGKGQHFFNVHPHTENGQTNLYSRVKKRNYKLSTDSDEAPTKLDISVNEDDLITETLTKDQIISRPVDKDLTSDEARKVADENSSLRKQIEELKAANAEKEALKSELAKLKEEKELQDQIAAEEKESKKANK